MALADRPVGGGHLEPVILGAIDDGVVVTTTSSTMDADEFVYSHLTRVSGPQSGGGTDYDMDTDSDVESSVFEYQVPAGYNFRFSRINITMVDGAIRPGQFGGLGGALTNGCLFQVVDVGGAEMLDFTDGVPITFNAELSLLAGVDTIIQPAAGDDWLPVRFSIFNAGAPMLLPSGFRVRWTNRDDVSGLTVFRMMVQGLLEGV